MMKMRRIVGILLTAVAALCTPTDTEAQVTYELVIDSVAGLPDTIEDGQEITFYMIVSTNSSLFYQGNIFIELEYAGMFFEADTSIASNMFIGPVSPSTIQATHRFSSDDGLGIGDNVVVVWPRIGDGTDPDQSVVNPYTRTITLVEPTGIRESSADRVRSSFIAPNPGNTRISFNFNEQVRMASLVVYDMAGRAVFHRSTAAATMDVSGLPLGVYFIEVLSTEGKVYYDRLLISR